jgi:transposase
MQDEMIKAWHHGHFSKTVQHSILGRLKAKLKPIAKSVLPASEPTTQLCYNCGQLRKMSLNRRVYVCDCGIKPEDRDVHSAKNMIFISKIKIPVEHRKSKRVEQTASMLASVNVSRLRRDTKHLR